MKLNLRLLILLATNSALTAVNTDLIEKSLENFPAENYQLCSTRLVLFSYERYIKDFVHGMDMAKVFGQTYEFSTIRAAIIQRFKYEYPDSQLQDLGTYLKSDLFTKFRGGQNQFFKKCAEGADIFKMTLTAKRKQVCNDLYFRLRIDDFTTLFYTERRLESQRRFFKKFFPSNSPDYERQLNAYLEKNRKEALEQSAKHRRLRTLPDQELMAYCGQYEALSDTEMQQVHLIALEPWFYYFHRIYYLGVLDGITENERKALSD